MANRFIIIIITGSIARSATCWYIIYSEADFEVFRPAGATLGMLNEYQLTE